MSKYIIFSHPAIFLFLSSSFHIYFVPKMLRSNLNSNHRKRTEGPRLGKNLLIFFSLSRAVRRYPRDAMNRSVVPRRYKTRILDFLLALYDKSLNAILIPLFGTRKTMLIYSCPSVLINGVSERAGPGYYGVSQVDYCLY